MNADGSHPREVVAEIRPGLAMRSAVASVLRNAFR
jgi:hypothetical protein